MLTFASLALFALTSARGFPLFFGSFDRLGEHEVVTEPVSAEMADDRLTRWTKGCPADVYVLVEDESPFDLHGLKPIQRHAENSLTRGSFITETPVNLHELALDLEEYCSAQLIELDPMRGEEAQPFVTIQTRVFYVKFAADLPAEAKQASLSRIMGIVPSPHVTLIYGSHVQQPQPVLRAVQDNPQRLKWSDERRNPEMIQPVIAPLFKREEPAELKVDLPDNFFATLALGSVLLAVFLAYRDFTS